MKRDKRAYLKNMRRFGNYVSNFVSYIFLPDSFLRWRAWHRMNNLSESSKEDMRYRVDYYCRLPEGAMVNDASVLVNDFTYPWEKKHKLTQYFFDLYRSIRLFTGNLRFHYLFGDIAYEPEVPTLVKSRPVAKATTMSVVCQLNRLRHFFFVDDNMPFRMKKDMLVFRNVTDGMPWRQDFLYKYANHPLCNVGHTNHVRGIDEELRKPFLPIDELLKYKFIACIEGGDVATNLKWVMSSNSVAVMPCPTRETWFMEGTLIPDYHFIEIKPDYSDLPERLQYFIAHPEKAEEIIQHAHDYIDRFRDQRFEALVQHVTVQEYFKQTQQWSKK